jgi:hypothetical protein
MSSSEHMVAHLWCRLVLHPTIRCVPPGPATIWLSDYGRYNRFLDVLFRGGCVLSPICRVSRS